MRTARVFVCMDTHVCRHVRVNARASFQEEGLERARRNEQFLRSKTPLGPPASAVLERDLPEQVGLAGAKTLFTLSATEVFISHGFKIVKLKMG